MNVLRSPIGDNVHSDAKEWSESDADRWHPVSLQKDAWMVVGACLWTLGVMGLVAIVSYIP